MPFKNSFKFNKRNAITLIIVKIFKNFIYFIGIEPLI